MGIVVGGGKFGLKAAEFLLRGAEISFFSTAIPIVRWLKKLGIKIKEAKAEKLVEIAEKLNPEWIFPTAPVHLVAEAIKDYFEPWNEVINCILSGIPPKLVVSQPPAAAMV